jgi:hypothetical protein
MKVNINKARNPEVVSLNGQMARSTKGNLTKTTSMERVPTSGVIKGNTPGTGNITKWMVRVYSNGQMAESIRVNIEMIRKTAMEFLNGNEYF